MCTLIDEEMADSFCDVAAMEVALRQKGEWRRLDKRIDDESEDERRFRRPVQLISLSGYCLSTHIAFPIITFVLA